MTEPHDARRLWQVLEPIHAVTYFSEDCAARYRALGLKGFWMGYFASRSAPFGEASPELVTATFFNFRPSMAARALPDAWALASPDAHVTFAATGAIPRERLQAARGWTDDEWDAAAAGLVARGWLDADGALTPQGRADRQAIEDRTDALAAGPWEALGRDGTDRLHELLLPLARAVEGAGVIPYPNPIGVPRSG